MKVKKHMIDTKQVEGEATTTDLLGRASQSNLKPTNKMKEVRNCSIYLSLWILVWFERFD